MQAACPSHSPRKLPYARVDRLRYNTKDCVQILNCKKGVRKAL